jgi:hypothetical protein
MIKVLICHEDITIVNIYAPLLEHLDLLTKTTRTERRNTYQYNIVGDFNTPPSKMDRYSDSKVNKGTVQ